MDHRRDRVPLRVQLDRIEAPSVTRHQMDMRHEIRFQVSGSHISDLEAAAEQEIERLIQPRGDHATHAYEYHLQSIEPAVRDGAGICRVWQAECVAVLYPKHEPF